MSSLRGTSLFPRNTGGSSLAPVATGRTSLNPYPSGVDPITAIDHPNLACFVSMDNESAPTVFDESPNNTDGTTAGSPSFVSGQINNAIDLNGTSQHIAFDNSLSNPTTMSVCGWVNFDVLSRANSIFSHGFLSFQASAFPDRIFVNSSNDIIISARDGDGGFASGAWPPNAGVWGFVVGIWEGNGNNLEIYVDDMATPVASGSQTQALQTTPDFAVGVNARNTASTFNFQDWMDGKVDEWRVFYDLVLTQSQREALKALTI